MRNLLLLFALAATAFAQSTITVPPIDVSQGQSGTLTLNLGGSPTPAAIEFTLTYPPNIITIPLANVVPGPVLTAATAQKSLACATPTPGFTVCIAAGMNLNTIANGVLATLNVQVASGTPPGPIGIGFVVGCPGTANCMLEATPTAEAESLTGPGSGLVDVGGPPNPPATIMVYVHDDYDDVD